MPADTPQKQLALSIWSNSFHLGFCLLLFGEEKKKLFTGFSCGVVAALVWPSMTSHPFHLWGLVLSGKCFSQVAVHQRDELNLDKVFVPPLSFTALWSRLKLSASLLPCMVHFFFFPHGAQLFCTKGDVFQILQSMPLSRQVVREQHCLSSSAWFSSAQLCVPCYPDPPAAKQPFPLALLSQPAS